MPLQVDPPNAAGILGLSEFPFPPGYSKFSGGVDILPADEKALVDVWASLRAFTAGVAIWFETWAMMGALPGPAVRTLAWVSEADAPYEFVPGDTTPADGYTSIANMGGTDGRWLLRANSISIAPLGGILDDWARFNSVMTALAYKGSVVLRDGTWLAKVAGIVPSGTHIVMSPGVRIVSTIVNAGFMSSIFAAQAVTIDTGAITVTPARYSNVVQVTMATKPVVGDYLELSHATSGATYRVDAISAGAAPWDVTVDRPIAYPFVITDPCSSFSSVPQDIRIQGNGAKLSGSGNQTAEFVNAWNVVLEDMDMDGRDGAPDGAAWGFDVGGYLVTMDRLYADMTGTVLAPSHYFQSCERAVGRGLRARGGDSGSILFDCYSSGLEACWAFNSARGVQVITLPDGGTASLGCFDCWVSGGGAVGCGIGLNVYGAEDTTVEEFSARGCTTAGFQLEIGVTSSGTRRTQVTDCTARGCAVGFVQSSAAVADTTVTNIDTSESVVACQVTGTISIGGWVHDHGVQTTQVATFNGAGSKIDGAKVVATVASATGVVIEFTGAGTDCRLSRSSISADPATTLAVYLNSATGVLHVSGTKLVGDRGIDTNNGGTIRDEPGNDFSGCTTPLPPNGAKFVSRGTVVANGAVAVPVAWPDIELSDAPIPYLTVRGATCVGGMPLVTVTPGVGFSFTGIGSDGVDTSWGFRFAS